MSNYVQTSQQLPVINISAMARHITLTGKNLQIFLLVQIHNTAARC